MKNTYYFILLWVICLSGSLYFNLSYKDYLVSHGYSISAAEVKYKNLSTIVFGVMVVLLLAALLTLNTVAAGVRLRNPNIKDMDDFLNIIKFDKLKLDEIRILSVYAAISSMFGAELGFVISMWIARSHL